MKLIRIIVTLGCLLSFASGLRAQQTCDSNIPESTPTADFIDHSDGTVTHSRSGLMWKRCSEGQTWSAGTCTGTASITTWQDALKSAVKSSTAGYSDWRVPNIKELQSIIEDKCSAPSINKSIFPNIPFWNFWSASAYVDNLSSAWNVSFYHGGSLSIVSKYRDNYVRLVRAGPPSGAFDGGGTTTLSSPLILAPGWNLLGNSDATPIDVASALGDASKVTTVWKWNATASTWAFYAPSMTTSHLATYAAGKGYDILTSIAPKQGFWVNAPAAGTLTGAVPNGVMLTEADLQVGWNLVSSADNLTPSQLNAGLNTSLNGAGKEITTLWAWEPTASQWKFYAPSLEAQGGDLLNNYIATKGYLPFTLALAASDGYWMNVGVAAVPTPDPISVTHAYRLVTATSHSCVITAAGAVKCWGQNAFGELGDGTNFPHLTPVNVLGLNSNIVALSAQNFRTCALTSTGGVKCWGNNDNGALGDGTQVFRRSPVDVVGLSSGVVQVSVGLFTTCALMKTGAVKCWGYNATGALGDGTTQKRLTPVDVVGLGSGVVAISSADRNCALTVSGGVKCWGSNIFGQIGDGTTVDRLTPVDVVGLSSGVLAISAGAYHTCVIINGGGVKCWGTNAQGELGDGTTLLRLAPVDVVGLGSGVASLAELEERMTCAVMSAGGAKCWGMNNVGQLGDGTKQNRLIPTDVVGLSSGVAAVSAGPYHSCALTTAGGVKCWGQNAYGQLGDGSTVYSSTPVDVVGF